MFQGLGLFEIVAVLISILVSMGIHEAMHAFTAHYLGDTTASDQGRLTLNPLAHIDLLTTVFLPVALIALGLPPFFIAKPVPFRPDMVRYGEFGAALVGVAGPLTNLLLAVVAAGVLKLGLIDPGTLEFNAAFLFLQVNVAFFVFNMIPFPPLDGSRLLYAFAPEPLQRLMYQIEMAGLTGIVIFMLLLYPLFSPVVVHIMDAVIQFLL